MTLSRNDIPFIVRATLITLIALYSGYLAAQVFPEVADPAKLKQKQLEEDRKLGQQYYNSEEYGKAIEIFRPMYEEDPSHYNYTYYLYCLIGLKEYDEAEELVKKKLKKTPLARYEIDLGFVYQLADKPDKAKKQFDEVLNSLNANKNEILSVSTSFIQRGQYDYAVKAYSKGKELLENSYTFTQEMARVYELTGEYGPMVEAYLDLLEEDATKLEFVQGRLQNALNKDSDEMISDQLREILLTRAQKNPDNRYYAEMLLWLSVQRRDFEFALIQAKSLDKRFNESGMTVFNLGNLSLDNGDYDIAIEAYRYILAQGPENPYYPEALTGELKARFLKITSGITYTHEELEYLGRQYTSALDQLGQNNRTIDLMRDLAHLEAFYLRSPEEAVSLLEAATGITNAPEKTLAECKIELGDIFLYQGEIWEAALLYMQVDKAFKNEPVGHQAKFKNAKLSFYIGEFDWARAQLDVLKAATSKLIANDAMELSLTISDNMDADSTYTGLNYYSKADLALFRNREDQALLYLDSIRMLGLFHPLDDEVLYKKAEISINRGNYETADSLLDKIVTDYSYEILADNALFKRAELYEKVFKNKEKAMELYQQLMLDFPGSLFATESRKRYRALRGDIL